MIATGGMLIAMSRADPRSPSCSEAAWAVGVSQALVALGHTPTSHNTAFRAPSGTGIDCGVIHHDEHHHGKETSSPGEFGNAKC